MRKFVYFGVLSILAACGSSAVGSGGGEDTFGVGATSPTESGNGADFATASSALSDTEGETMRVKVARFVTDMATGESELIVTSEEVTFLAGDGGNAANITLTVDDETLTFTSNNATDSLGQDWFVSREYGGTFSATASYQTYSSASADTGFVSEGFFIFGYETDPAEIAALTGSATYTGEFHSDGAYVTADGSQSPEHTFGTINLNANFDSGMIDGDLTGNFGRFGAVEGTIAEVEMGFNGFESTATLDNCADGFTCTSNTTVSGAFFGPDGAELTGLIGFDLTRTDDTTGATEGVVAGGAYVATSP